ncbi:MAG: two-component system response regulator, partial [Anaerolineales bacterium]
MPDIVPKILIVHAPPQQVTLQAVLAPLAYTCLVAEDVPTARRILAEQTPHLIILDPKLPAALDFCAEVIHLAHAPAPRVLIYADDHAEDTVRAALDAGADDYRHTSVPAPLLLNDVRRLVEQHSNTAHLAYLQRLNAALYADATMLNTGAVFQTMLDVVGNALHAKSAFIVRHDPESDLADIMVSYAGFGAVLPPKGDWEMHTFSLDDFPVSGEWILQDAPYLAINLQDYTFEGVEARFFAQLEPDEKMLHVTIPLDEAPHRYYMQIWRHGYFGPFTALEIQLVMSVAHQVTANLRSARLYDALKRSQDELQNYTAALEARNLELDAYAHTIAHRLKSPLNLIA